MKKSVFLGIVIAIVLSFSIDAFSKGTAGLTVPSNEKIHKILMERLGESADQAGIVVGVIEPSGRRVIAAGTMGENKEAADENTIFEIGSITKVFTSLLLADMAERGEVILDDPVSNYLPSGVKMPERNGRVITLEELSRHRSGLPRVPSNLDEGMDLQNPYAHYSERQLYAFLSNYDLPREIGAEFEYSNLGGGLLGYVLARHAGKDYEALVKARICLPLGMKNTAISLSSDMKSRLAIGHDDRFEPTSNWGRSILDGAYALRSTVTDMLSFLAAQMGYEGESLSSAINLSHSLWTPADPGMEIALGWLKKPTRNSAIIWHNGGTGGYRSFAGFDPKARTGVVVLTNVATMAGVDDLGMYLLDPDFQLLSPDSPLLQPRKKRIEISLSPEILERYVGRYELAPEMIIKITREGSQLYSQPTGMPQKAEIFPESESDFFARVADVQLIFKSDGKGRVNALIFRQMGIEQLAKRIDSEADPVEEWFGHRIAEVDPKIFDNYVGRYQLVPGVEFMVTREDNRLFVQLTGQQLFEVFPEGERDFFVKDVDAQVTFETNGAGQGTALILHLVGLDQRASKIEE